MAIETIQVTIKGESPLLMNRFPLEPIEAMAKKKPAEQAEISAYRDEATGNLYIPGVALQRCLVAGAAYSKGKGRATLQKPVAACVLVSPEKINLGVSVYQIDSRAVVIAATKGRIIRHRARLDEWSVTFAIEYDPDLITESELRRVVDDSGKRVGLLDFRPERKGMYGRFMVIAWN